MKALRAAVSGSRVRYVQNGYDLDLTYITPRVIAMGYPASGLEKAYRNDISEVATLLDARHPRAYRVYNLSERRYDYAKFHNNVLECGFPDHHPPPLPLLFDIINDMLAWTAQSERNVVVVHCMAGKGRTGVVCSCFVLLTGAFGDLFATKHDRELREMANRAIREFWDVRGQGVRFPSQALYIYYFVRIVRRLGRLPPQIPAMRAAKPLLLERIVLRGIPDFESGSCTPFLQVLPAPSQHNKHELLYNSSWLNASFDTYEADPLGVINYETNCVIQGDVLIRCFHANSSSMLGRHVVQMFHVTFHTDFFRRNCNVYRLPLSEVDEAHKDSRFPTTFILECHVGPVEEALNTRGSSTSVATTQRSSTPDVVTAQGQQPRETTPMMGWMYKQGGFVRNWKKRWFVARDGKLMYYSTVSDPTPLGVIDLRGVVVHICRAEETTARNRALQYFKLTPQRSDQRIWYFGVESEDDLVKWVRSLATQACFGLSNAAVSALARREYQSERSIASIAEQSRRSEPWLLRHSDTQTAQWNPAEKRQSQSMLNVDVAAAGLRGSTGSQRSFVNASTTDYRDIARVRSMGSRSDSLSNDATTLSVGSTDDPDDRYVTSGNVTTYISSRPLPPRTTRSFSENDRRTMLHGTQGDFEPVYTADQLQDAAALQAFIKTTKIDDGLMLTISEHLSDAIARNDYARAEQLLTEVVMIRFPQLIDILECNPRAFLATIVGVQRNARGATMREVEF